MPCQEHNTVSLARARTWTAQSGDERTKHEATAIKKTFTRNLRAPFIKVEDHSRRHSPVFKKFNSWPSIDFQLCEKEAIGGRAVANRSGGK